MSIDWRLPDLSQLSEAELRALLSEFRQKADEVHHHDWQVEGAIDIICAELVARGLHLR